MDNRYEIAEQNGMSREFADWFFDNKKAGCGNDWFVMMAVMWEGWKGSAAMLQAGNSPVITDCWVPCSERMPTRQDGTVFLTWNGQYIGKELYLMGSFQCLKPEIITHWMPLPAAPQQEAE